MARKYSDEFKRETLRLIDEGATAPQVSKDLDVPVWTIRDWIRKSRDSVETPAKKLTVEEENRQLREENRRLKLEREILKKSDGLLREREAMRFEFIEAHRQRYPVTLMCRVLEVSTSGYYAWRSRPMSDRIARRRSLCEAIREVFEESRGIYGSPRVHPELVKQGIDCCVNTVAALMRRMGLRSKTRKPFRPRTTDGRHGLGISPNVLDREFHRKSMNEAWAVDITYIPTGEGWLYLAVVLDLCSRRVIGWSMADHLRADLALDALLMAVETRGSVDLTGVLHHSDRGVQYASDAYQQMLRRHGLTSSMSRKGNCWDNAVVESFFGTLKTELVNHQRYKTHEQARRSIFEYLEVFYNRKRIHSALGYVSPVEFERRTG